MSFANLNLSHHPSENGGGDQDIQTNSHLIDGEIHARASPSQEWEIVRRTNSDSSSLSKLKFGTYNLVVGFLEVLRHAVVLLPDSDIHIVLNEQVLNWQTLIVLANSDNAAIRCSTLRLFNSYLERAPTACKNKLIKSRGFLLFANQLYQHPATTELVEAALLLVSSRAEPLLECNNSSGISVKDLDPTALPAVAPLLALIENAHSDDLLSDSICWSVKEMFEAHNELGDTMLDRGLSIVLCNVINRQSDQSQPISPALLALLHSVVQRCCTTNSEHFLVVQDIIDALSHQEMKETEDSLDELVPCENNDDTGSDRGTVFCDSCYRICELRRILFSVYCIAIESLLMNTDLATERLSEDAIRRSSSLFSISERVPNSSTSTPKHKGHSSNSGENVQYKFKIPESEITARLSLIIRNAIARIQYQGPAKCGQHNDLLNDELSAKHSHISSQSTYTSHSNQNETPDFDSIFATQIFYMLLHWVAEAVSFGQQPAVRTAKTRLAQRLALPLAPHFAQLITFMVSPVGGKARLVPLSIAREINRKNILLFIYNGCQYEANQIQLYLQYLT